MAATTARKRRQEKPISKDHLDELIALARMISYAKAVSEDLKIEQGTQSLDLALTAVTRELRRTKSSFDIAGLDPMLARINIELH
jgi:hypothetical protein